MSMLNTEKVVSQCEEFNWMFTRLYLQRLIDDVGVNPRIGTGTEFKNRLSGIIFPFCITEKK